MRTKKVAGSVMDLTTISQDTKICSPVSGCEEHDLVMLSAGGKLYIGGVAKFIDNNTYEISYPVWIMESMVPSEVNKSFMVNIGLNKPFLSVSIPEVMTIAWDTMYFFNKNKKKDMDMRFEYGKSVTNLIAMDSNIVVPNMNRIQ